MSVKWTVVATIPQVDGGAREVLVPSSRASEVREVLRQDPARVERLWVPTRLRDVR